MYSRRISFTPPPAVTPGQGPIYVPGPSYIPTVNVNPIDTLLPAQQAAASAPYTNVMSQIANALSNPTGATAAPRVMLTPTPVSSVSSFLSSLPSWALPAALVVGGLALVGGAKKGRR